MKGFAVTAMLVLGMAITGCSTPNGAKVGAGGNAIGQESEISPDTIRQAQLHPRYPVMNNKPWMAPPSGVGAKHFDPLPSASGFAAIDDSAAIPYLSPADRATYLAYLAAPVPKAFAISQQGMARWVSGDTQAMRRALAICSAHPGAQCWLYAVDDRVVWQADESRRVTLLKLAEHHMAWLSGQRS
jgi:hypothetical protein